MMNTKADLRLKLFFIAGMLTVAAVSSGRCQPSFATEDEGDVKLGALSAKYESGRRGPETVSSGKGDPGGVSYGTYQLASKLGNADRFVLQYYRNVFENLKGGTSEFTEVWKATVAKDPKAFHRNEHEFIKRTHFDPQCKLIESKLSIDLRKRSAALRDVIWSCAVHHGPNTKIVVNAARDTKSDAEWIAAIYAERGRVDSQGKLVYFQKISDDLKPSLLNRFREELKDALKMLESEK